MDKDSTAKPWETRTDELESYALEECVKRQRLDRQISVMIMPSNRAELAIQFAQLGARVTVADETACRQEIEGRALAAGRHDNIAFSPCILPYPPEQMAHAPFDIIFVRRSLCNVPYEKARQIVRQLLQQLKIGGKLYLTILGLHSELGEDYPGSELSIDERFTDLAPAAARKYGIDHPVCLYSERDLFMLLLESGGSVLRTLTTTYGNVKGIGVRV